MSLLYLLLLLCKKKKTNKNYKNYPFKKFVPFFDICRALQQDVYFILDLLHVTQFAYSLAFWNPFFTFCLIPS